MSIQKFPLDMVADGEAFTTEEWTYITRDWNLGTEYLAVVARSRPYEARQACANDAFNSAGLQAIDPEYTELLTALWSLSDAALDRLIASFSEEDKQLLNTTRGIT